MLSEEALGLIKKYENPEEINKLENEVKKSSFSILTKAQTNDNEPVFIIRAQDLFAMKTLKFYIDLIEQNLSKPSDLYVKLLELQLEFTKWRNEHQDKLKFPD